MSAIKNALSLYHQFTKIIKGSGTSFQSPVLSEKHVKNVCRTAHQYLVIFHFNSVGFKRYKQKFNFQYVAISMMTSMILKSVDFITITKI